MWNQNVTSSGMSLVKKENVYGKRDERKQDFVNLVTLCKKSKIFGYAPNLKVQNRRNFSLKISSLHLSSQICRFPRL